MDIASQKKYLDVIKYLEKNFPGDGELDLNGVLFIIGIQELGKGYQKFSKDEKMNLIHIAICTVLEPYGFYKFKETDNDGWPHFEKTAKLPSLNLKEQEDLLKEAVINYFTVNKYF